jgi:IclR family transcriptional regulator, pca regulon regulatory protein
MPRLQAADAQMRAAQEAGGDYLQSLSRGLRIIVAFNGARRGMTLSELSRATSLPRATVRRTLLTLGRLNYVESDGNLFHLTPKVMELAAAYLTSNAILPLLQSVCEVLARDLGNTASAAVLNDNMATIVAAAHPPRGFSNESWIGLRMPAYRTALGRVLLAALSEAELDAYLEPLKVEAATPYTVTDKAAIREAVRQVRRDGFCIVDREADPDLRMAACPVRRVDDRIVAAVGIGSHSGQHSIDDIRAIYLPRLRREVEGLRVGFS